MEFVSLTHAEQRAYQLGGVHRRFGEFVRQRDHIAGEWSALHALPRAEERIAAPPNEIAFSRRGDRRRRARGGDPTNRERAPSEATDVGNSGCISYPDR